MKRYNSSLLVSAVALSVSLAGCNDSRLDITQKGVDLTQTVENYYTTDEAAEAAIAKVYVDTQKNFAFLPDINGYNYGPYFALTNFQADDIYLAGSGSGDCVGEREYHDFRFTTENSIVLGGYTALYRSIHKCNLVITMVPPGSAVQKRAIAEARVMRAFAYMTLAIYWGQPPRVEEILDAESQPENTVWTRDEVFQWCADECDLAYDDLDIRESTGDAYGAYHVTKGFANAIKGKCLLWKKDYAGAKTALKSVITSGKYALLPGNEIGKILHSDGKGSSESVFEFFYDFIPGVTDGWESALRTNCNAHMTFAWRSEQFKGLAWNKVNNNGWGWLNPTGDFARALIANDGDSYRRKAWIVTYDEMLADNDFWMDPANKGIKEGQVLANCEGFFNYKTCCHPNQGDINPNGDRQTRNYPIMRYAEVLLLYAEACAMTNDNDGLQYLNAIQERAGSAHVSSSLTLDEVKKEKQFELWMEGSRSADLIRWGDTETLKTADFYTPGFDHNGNIVDDYYDGSDYYKRNFGNALGFKDGKNELLPFPQKVVDLNKGITQNPGW